MSRPAALLERSAGYLLASLSGVTGADLARPTPCTRWDLRALLVHVADAAEALTDLVTSGRLELAAPARSPADPVIAARERTRRLLGAWATATRHDTLCQVADRPLWASTAAGVGAIEFTAHGWDVATARGLPRQIPAGLAADLLELSPSLITDRTRRPEFGAAVPVPAGASPGDRLVAFLGRRPARTGHISRVQQR